MRGQAATEFLMTYGWALLVVAVAIGALAFFGVLSPDRFLPEKCTLDAGYHCVDYKLTESQGDIIIKNAAGDEIIITALSIGSCGGTFDTTIKNSKQATFTLTGCDFGAKGSSYKDDIIVTYRKAVSNFTKEMAGEIVTKIQ